MATTNNLRIPSVDCRRTCIIVSPYFPPSTLAGVHRGRHLAKHLPSTGWWPIVVCVDERHHEQKLDYELANLVPETVELVKTGAVPTRWVRPIGLGDIGIRGLYQIRSAVNRLMRERKVDAVLITGSPYYPMLLAPELKRRFGVPVVLDFQDPWVSNWGSSLPLLSKGGISHQLGVALEPVALSAAAYISSVSETQNEQLADRYRFIDRSRMAAIPIGSEPEEFAVLRSRAKKEVEPHLDPNKVNLNYVGTVVPDTFLPVFEVFFRGVAQLKRRKPDLVSRLRLNFIGTSNQPSSGARPALLHLASQLGVGDIVHEHPERVPYLDALTLLASSDVILIVGSYEPHYTASKIYPILMSGRPHFSIFHQRSSAHKILESAGGGIALAFPNREALPTLEGAVANALEQVVTKPESVGSVDPRAYQAYEAGAIAQRFADIFNLLVEGKN